MTLKRLLSGFALVCFTLGTVAAQQPQTQTAPISAINSKYTNGVAPGYAPTAGTGLVLNLGGGTSFCSGTITQYSAGTLTLTASATNYIYLNTAASCVPATKTTAFTNSDIPLAIVVTGASSITSITDVRSPFFTAGGGGVTGSVNLTGLIGTYSNGLLQSYGSPFSISMTCVAGGVTIGSGTFEIGYATTNPNVCTLTPSNGTPTSPTSVSDGTNSYTDTTPYTVFTGAYSYTTNTTFSASATATNGQTATASKTFTVSPCTFSGLTTNAAPTSATASGSGAGNQCASETSTLTGGGTLTSHGLGSTTVGTVFSFSSPGGDYITLFLTETSSGCNRNPFTFNGSSPVNGTTQAISSYTNILGGVQTNMCLYTFGPYSSAVTLTVAH